MPRKERAAVSSGMNDLLGNVIQSDRQRAGRGEEPTATSDTMTENNDIESESNTAITQYDNNAITPEAPPRRRAARAEPAPEIPLPSQRAATARQMAKSPTMTVTLRLPVAFNEWLDEYLHGSYPVKVKKQELVIEALQLLYARRGKPKEQILDTDLLPPEP